MITPTASDRALRLADFSTLVEALDYAALGETGLTLHGLRGEVTEALTYRDLREQAHALAARLAAAGLRKGDRVGLIAETDGDFARAFFACQYAGLVPAPLPTPAPLAGRATYVEQIARMLQAARAGALITPAGMAAWVEDLSAAARAADVALCFAGALADLPQAERQAGPIALPPIAPPDPCYIQFSSGSTRFPTGVLVTHAALMANAVAITEDGLNVRPDDRAVSWLPLYHDMGLIGFLLSPLTVQMSVDLLPTGAFVRRPLLWLDILSRNGGTVSYSPTFGYELCARRAQTADLSNLDLSRWRIAGAGGDMIRPEPLRDFAAAFAASGFSADAFVASYGMAEATLALSMAPLDQGLRAERLSIAGLEEGKVAPATSADERSREFVRCGPALRGHALEVRDETGRALGDRRIGRVFAQGPSLMRGYFERPDITAEVLSADGWLDTGDIGYLADGEIVLTGRSKDLMILNGRNIWPQDLEWTAEAQVEGLRSGDVAVFSIPGDGEEIVTVLAQTRSSDPEVRARLQTEVADLLRRVYGVEAQVHLVGAHALPHTSSGKLSRARAKAMFLAGLATEPA